LTEQQGIHTHPNTHSIGRAESNVDAGVPVPGESGEKWREVERSGEKWREVERSGEKWREVERSGEESRERERERTENRVQTEKC